MARTGQAYSHTSLPGCRATLVGVFVWCMIKSEVLACGDCELYPSRLVQRWLMKPRLAVQASVPMRVMSSLRYKVTSARSLLPLMYLEEQLSGAPLTTTDNRRKYQK
ncbi:hypothetical protein SRHO_G00087270 [Serrasalmus rhombeus]